MRARSVIVLLEASPDFLSTIAVESIWMLGVVAEEDMRKMGYLVQAVDNECDAGSIDDSHLPFRFIE